MLTLEEQVDRQLRLPKLQSDLLLGFEHPHLRFGGPGFLIPAVSMNTSGDS